MSTALSLKIIVPVLVVGGLVAVLVHNEHPAGGAPAKPQITQQELDTIGTVVPRPGKPAPMK